MVHDGNSQVNGELYHCLEIGECLEKLDWIEGFHGYDSDDSLFTRVVSRVIDENHTTWAWTYMYNRESNRIIESGDWRTKDQF